MALKGNQQTTVSHFWCSPKKNIPISSLQIGFQAAAVRCQLCAPGGICGAKLLVLPAKLVVLLPQAVQLLRPFLLFACASSLVAKGSVQRGYAQLPKLAQQGLDFWDLDPKPNRIPSKKTTQLPKFRNVCHLLSILVIHS